MNLGTIWGNLTVKERKLIFKAVGIDSWDNFPFYHPVNNIIVNKEFNKMIFFDLKMVIKSVKLYKLNSTMSFSEMEMIEILLKKLKDKL